MIPSILTPTDTAVSLANDLIKPLILIKNISTIRNHRDLKAQPVSKEAQGNQVKRVTRDQKALREKWVQRALSDHQVQMVSGG